MWLIIKLIKYIYSEIMDIYEKIKFNILTIISIQKFLIFPTARFILSINRRIILLSYKLWFLFNYFRYCQLNLRSNSIIVKYFLLINFVLKNYIYFVKIKLMRGRYISSLRIIIRLHNFRFLKRCVPKKYRGLYDVIMLWLKDEIIYNYLYLHFYKYINEVYFIFMLFYIGILFFLFNVSMFIFFYMISTVYYNF